MRDRPAGFRTRRSGAGQRARTPRSRRLSPCPRAAAPSAASARSSPPTRSPAPARCPIPLATSPGPLRVRPAALALLRLRRRATARSASAGASPSPRSPARPTRGCPSTGTPRSRTSSSSPAPRTWCRSCGPTGRGSRTTPAPRGSSFTATARGSRGCSRASSAGPATGTGEVALALDHPRQRHDPVRQGRRLPHRRSADPPRIFSWLICESYDDKGNAIVYEYAAEDAANVDLGQANERNRARAGQPLSEAHPLRQPPSRA